MRMQWKDQSLRRGSTDVLPQPPMAQIGRARRIAEMNKIYTGAF